MKIKDFISRNSNVYYAGDAQVRCLTVSDVEFLIEKACLQQIEKCKIIWQIDELEVDNCPVVDVIDETEEPAY